MPGHSDTPAADHVCDGRCPKVHEGAAALADHIQRLLANQLDVAEPPEPLGHSPWECGAMDQPCLRLDGIIHRHGEGGVLRHESEVLAAVDLMVRQILHSGHAPTDRGIAEIIVSVRFEGYDPTQDTHGVREDLGPIRVPRHDGGEPT